MTECTTDDCQVTFDFFKSQKVTAAFDDGAVTSNAGLALIAQLDRRIGWTARLAGCLEESRDRRFIVHSLLDLVRQRIYQIAAGYEDCNDADRLRTDPLLKAACGRHPDDDADLASQPTFSRFENVRRSVEVFDLNEALLGHYVDRRKGRPAPRRIILDLDSTDDPTHGQQEFSFFHGYYDQYMYLPLLCFDGETGELLAIRLRPGNVASGEGAVAMLRAVVRRLRAKWPRVKILIRGDAGFGFPELYEFCEGERGVDYIVGIGTNSRLAESVSPLAFAAEKSFENTGVKARLYGEASYRARRWSRERRLIMKAEYDSQGHNDRFLITSLPAGTLSAERVYDCYRQHGDMENRIKDLKNALFGDRLSCHRFTANAMRLMIHAAAYVLMWELRARLEGTYLATAQFDTLRLRLLKIGARVKATARRIWLHITSACPDREVWMLLARRILASTA
jgi:hypothetical protein